MSYIAIPRLAFSGNFRLFGMKMKEALSALGADPSQDVATGLHVNAQIERSSCKTVDPDPRMQMVSMLFGLRIALTDRTHDYLSGYYMPSAFRDYLNSGSRPTLSAQFVAVLTDLEWSELADNSPTLSALKTAAEQNGGKLSIDLTPYNFSGPHWQGSIVDATGTYRPGDPNRFMAGRRLANEANRFPAFPS